ncbi:uncharacterized protein N7482_009143 [Penicillium canariense]|uniref:Uncharacterized protein n=1 Tax=Penicillium canariense TaxID=189055 RepID=A0A9W9HQ63_9EURO|nr:uncharacterized protein N7482_009143 [Penicillium canariense]KAJ5152665.1 hypothetical protein N7482_009143 [Penicillium canariense]
MVILSSAAWCSDRACLSGGSIGGAVFPLGLNNLAFKIGFERWSTRIMGLITPILLIVGCLFVSANFPRTAPSPRSTRLFLPDLMIWKEPVLALTNHWLFFFECGFFYSARVCRLILPCHWYPAPAVVLDGRLPQRRLLSREIVARYYRGSYWAVQYTSVDYYSVSSCSTCCADTRWSKYCRDHHHLSLFGFAHGSDISSIPVCVLASCALCRIRDNIIPPYTPLVLSRGLSFLCLVRWTRANILKHALTGVPIAGEILHPAAKEPTWD